MSEISLKIEGMSCQHCVASVKKALDGLSGITSSEVSVGGATVQFDDTVTNSNAIADAVRNAGYTIAG